MNRTQGILLATLIGAGVLIAIPPCLFGSSGLAHADGAAPAGSATVGEPPSVSTLAPMRDGFKWGITHTDVITQFTKLGGLYDQDFDPLLRRAQPGVQQQSLEADRDNKKAAVERSYVRFVTPTGYDSTGLKGEYTYGNQEALLYVDRQGKKRYFFFIGAEPTERLWKIYDEIPLSAAGLGKTFAEAVNKVQGILGVAGRVRPADPSNGLDYTTVDWQDGQTHLRMVDRTKTHVVGVVMEERATLNALPQLRANKADDPLAMDPSIAAATRGAVSDPNHPGASPSASASAKPRHK